MLLSYSKIRLYQQLLDSDIPEEGFFADELLRYFPEQLQERFAHLMTAHRLKREIIATQVTNSLVNRMGVTFVMRMRDDTGATAAEVARAYTVARELMDARDYWERVQALDNKAAAGMQTEALLIMWNQLRQITRWLANLPGPRYRYPGHARPPETRLRSRSENPAQKSWTKTRKRDVEAIELRFSEAGFPKRFAHRIATLHLLFPMLDVVETAADQELDVQKVAKVYRGLGESLGLRWLRAQVEQLGVEGQWHAHARGNLRDELYDHHRELVNRAIRACGIEGDPVMCWIGKNHDDVQRVIEMMDDMRNQSQMDYATVSVAVRSLGQLLTATR